MINLAKDNNVIKVVDNEILTPTNSTDLSKQLVLLVKSQKFGTYHITSNGSCSWYEFAKNIFNIANLNVSLEKADASDFNKNINRPKYSVLKNNNLQIIDLDVMPHWRDALDKFINSKEFII